MDLTQALAFSALTVAIYAGASQPQKFIYRLKFSKPRYWPLGIFIFLANAYWPNIEHINSIIPPHLLIEFPSFINAAIANIITAIFTIGLILLFLTVSFKFEDSEIFINQLKKLEEDENPENRAEIALKLKKILRQHNTQSLNAIAKIISNPVVFDSMINGSRKSSLELTELILTSDCEEHLKEFLQINLMKQLAIDLFNHTSSLWIEIDHLGNIDEENGTTEHLETIHILLKTKSIEMRSAILKVLQKYIISSIENNFIQNIENCSELLIRLFDNYVNTSTENKTVQLRDGEIPIDEALLTIAVPAIILSREIRIDAQYSNFYNRIIPKLFAPLAQTSPGFNTSYCNDLFKNLTTISEENWEITDINCRVIAITHYQHYQSNITFQRASDHYFHAINLNQKLESDLSNKLHIGDSEYYSNLKNINEKKSN